MAFMVWLLRFWTWFKAFFSVRWAQTPPLHEASLDTSVGVEQLLLFDEGHHESELRVFLASMPKDREFFYYPGKDGFRLSFSDAKGSWRDFSGGEPTHREFLAAVASSKVASGKRICLGEYGNHCNLKLLEDMVRSLVPNRNFREVTLRTKNVLPLQMAECVSNLLSRNKAIEQLNVFPRFDELVGKEAAELLANGLRKNRVIKKLVVTGINRLVDDEAMEVFTMPFKENDSVLQELHVGTKTDVGDILRTNTSRQRLTYRDMDNAFESTQRNELFMRGYTSLSEALCVNRSLKFLECTDTSNMELKVLLQPSMPSDNKPQANTTLTHVRLIRSWIGGKEGVDIVADMIRTNNSLLRFELIHISNSDFKSDCCKMSV